LELLRKKLIHLHLQELGQVELAGQEVTLIFLLLVAAEELHKEKLAAAVVEVLEIFLHNQYPQVLNQLL
jgi:hypothetical protein